MRRTTWKQIGVGAMAALLAVGCATGNPQRRPETNTVQGSTTGDLDACALALGNAPGAGTAGGGAMGAGGGGGTTGGAMGAGTKGGTGTLDTNGGADRVGFTPLGAPGTGGLTEATANGIMVGNVALVALPDYDYMPTTNPPGVTGPPNGAPGTLGTPATPGNPMPPGTPDTAGNTGAPGTTGYTGTIFPPGNMGVADGGLPGTGAGFGTTGAAAGGTTGAGGGGATGNAAGATGNNNQTGGSTALDRIRTACVGLSEIRVVTEDADQARLAEIASAMRHGTPVTAYMADIARIASRASLAGGGIGTGAGGGSGGAVTPQSHGTGPGLEQPGTQGNPAAP
ncbi:MAG: hypothetical protein K0R39_4457 [Symbiobacteriaceae bacterium]|jgi:hypothetical protein|nr:hypothetical protein [Symbiobacteriaceae bacterium]